jgi:hypothetical protein
MAEAVAKIAWALLALAHAPPALAFFRPSLIERLYGTSPDGELGLLLTHRAALFLAVAAAAVYALLVPDARRLASIMLAISMISFLYLYWRAGMPAGSLRTNALVDLAAIPPLLVAAWLAWRP